jgi:putative transposase
MIRIPIHLDQYYHVYNRGVDHRIVYSERSDFLRFLRYLDVLNDEKPIQSLHVMDLPKYKYKLRGSTSKLVDIVFFCLNTNHFHLLLTPLSENGLQKFMQRLSTGYTMFFNEKYKRSGSLFQGRYKCVHVASNEQILYVGSYVAFNYIVHDYKTGDYLSCIQSVNNTYKINQICNSDIVLGQYPSIDEFVRDGISVTRETARRRKNDKVFSKLCID